MSISKLIIFLKFSLRVNTLENLNDQEKAMNSFVEEINELLNPRSTIESLFRP